MKLNYKYRVKYDRNSFYRFFEIDLLTQMKKNGFNEEDFNHINDTIKQLVIPVLDTQVIFRVSQLIKWKNILDFYIPNIRWASRKKDINVAAKLLADFLYDCVANPERSLKAIITCFTQKSPSTILKPRSVYEYNNEVAEFIDRIWEDKD